MTESDPIQVNHEDLTLVIEVDGCKYRYADKIHEHEELEYLALRYRAFLKNGTIKSYLTTECKAI